MESALPLWLEGSGLSPRSIEPLPGDLSQRQYFRVRLVAGGSLLVAHYPSSMAASQAKFLAVQRMLDGAGVAVPRVLASGAAEGFMALEDLGEETVHDLASAGADVGRFIGDALEQRQRIAALEPGSVSALGNPPLDAALLNREIDLTFAHLFEPRGIAELGQEARDFRASLAVLCNELGALDPVPCHRDFMVRNLMPRNDRYVVLLDFQDLRFGPPTYDLASLLNDSWYAPAEFEERAIAKFAPGRPGLAAYRRAVVQRGLKAAGTFARFAAGGNRRHLPLIAPTLARVTPHLARLPETARSFRRVESWWYERLSGAAFC
ncbi:MAG: phosphotransferase [Thermoanaerobaculia bacterium]